VLDRALSTDPALEAEWNQTQKLRADPRLTSVGRALRRLSLDELPQLWNILRQEMSLVGPRPIIREEIHKYGQAFELYTQVRPGLTGLWQVSGRSNLTYDERVRLDAYYVRNWSVWLDIVIILRTFLAVLTGRGAY
jgi:lipopolysaccharide/colanic/teichoic acid biosynthesis glycosyltransferase